MAKQLGLLVWLLLCFLSTVQGEEKRARNKDLCTIGIDAVENYKEWESCRSPGDSVGSFRTLYDSMNNATVAGIQDLLTNYCSSVKPYLDQCFLQNMQKCTADQQDVLRRVVSETGFVCQPNSTLVQPDVMELLSRMSDSDFAENAECSGMSWFPVYGTCSSEAFAAVGMSPEDPDFRGLEQFSIQELFPRMQGYLGSYLECVVTGLRDDPNRCPQWRGQALQSARYMVIPSLLGIHMPFNREQLLQMFEYGDQQTQTGCV